MNKRWIIQLFAVCMAVLPWKSAEACTGITLKSQDGAVVLARTIEWAGSYLNSRYVVVPRGFTQKSYLPDGKKDGMEISARYGFVGVAVEADEYITEGLNEAGLSAGDKEWNGVTLSPFGGGSGLLGLPGDVTPPSRFIRAAFYQMTAPEQATAEKTIQQAFQILNNFDIPIGIQYGVGQTPVDIPSATQWTAATDLTNRRFYYRTMYDSSIRCFDLNTIDFSRVSYRVENIDKVKSQPIIRMVVD